MTLTRAAPVTRAPLAAVAAGCLALAAPTLLLPSTPTYDPWTWMLWGREVAGLDLDTRGGPAFKPLPVAIGAALSPLGDAAPWAWLVLARAGALMAVAMAWRLGRRLGGAAAGVLAAAGVALAGGFVWHGALGNAEGLLVALALVGFERALEGRYRQALVLGFLASLVRTEAALFLVAYCGWLWGRDGGARVWIAAALAALPVAWLGPDLVAAGDALRSSERARVPNPGAPVLSDQPALESLSRALALAPTVVWAGALLALAGAWRRELPRVAALPAAAGVAWIALVAAMSELGYSGEERYALPGVALVAVAAGAGAGWALEAVIPGGGVTSVQHMDAIDHTPPRRGRFGVFVIAAVLLALAIGETAGGLSEDVRGLEYEARLYNSLDDAVAGAGGAACRPIHTAPYSRPALAWRLRLPLREISTVPARSGTVFRARPYRRAEVGPALAGSGFVEVARAGEWTVLSTCSGGSP